jgi:hypothetical protein
MGRLSKYKKIKDVDPYSKKNGGRVDLSKVGIWGLGDNGRKPKKRSKRSELLRANKKQRVLEKDEVGFDLPPGRDEFDLKDLMGSVKKQKMTNPLAESVSKNTKDQELFAAERVVVNGNVATIPKTDRDEKKAARVLNVRDQVNKDVAKKIAKSHARRDGESKNAYAKRTKAETRQIIKQTTETKNPEKKQKKKEFLQNKKKNKKKGFSSFAMDDEVRARRDEGESDSDTFITGERAIAMADEVRFGEQAERPPTFRQLPRGAKDKEGTLKGKSAKISATAKAKGMTEEAVEAENKSMEMMRRRVQAQYETIKLKRRLAGDFHL